MAVFYTTKLCHDPEGHDLESITRVLQMSEWFL